MKPTEEQLKDPKWWRSYFVNKYNYNPKTGELKNRFGKVITKRNKDGYVVISPRVDMKRYDFLVHRVAFLIVNERWPLFIDHINGDPSDNRMVNLREVSHSENMRNQKTYKNNKTGVCGIHKKDGSFSVSIQSKGSRVTVGRFKDFFEACCARKSAELRYEFHVNHGRTQVP